MEKEFVPYELALKMKELGFDEPCLAYYSILEIHRTGEHNLHYTQRGKEILRENDWSWVYRNFPKFRKYLKAEHCYKYSTNSSKLIASAPTWQSAFRWFREKYQIFPEVLTDCTTEPKFVYTYNTFYGNPKDLTEQEWGWENNIGQYSDIYRTYEEAELECLKKLIEIVESKSK
jgi:hypothetical protein